MKDDSTESVDSLGKGDSEDDNGLQEARRLLELANISAADQDLSSPPFSSVTQLNLTGCGLSKLPNNFETFFPNLSILFLSNNSFKEMPAVIGKCPQLQMVAFKSNHMTSIHPDALQPQLRWLILTDNGLQTIPDSIARCTRLQKLMLSGNDLVELPEHAMSCCTQLELIRLASNQLQQPPTTLLATLPNLKWVALGDNPFVASLYEQHEMRVDIPVLADVDGSSGDVLGSGAGGTTRKVFYAQANKYLAVKSFDAPHYHHHDTTATAPLNTKTLRRMTSDGRPEHEALVFCAASAATGHHHPPTVVQVVGQTSGHGLVMEYLHDFQALADPPSMQSCTRDVYNKKDSSASSSVFTRKHAHYMVSQLLEAQVALHANGICHGDFYGHNILVHWPSHDDDSSDFEVRLSDFGAAFFYDTQADWGKSLQVCELRAFGVLVQEVQALLLGKEETNLMAEVAECEPTKRTTDIIECKEEGLDSNSEGDAGADLLQQLATKCLVEDSATFDSVAIWWKQKQLKLMATALHHELFD